MEAVLDRSIDKLFNIEKKHINFLKIALTIKDGFPAKYLLILKNLLKLNNSVMAELLGVSTRTITRYIQNDEDRLDSNISDRIYRLFYILYKAIEVFENKKEAVYWLKVKQYGLNNRVPIDLLTTEAGAKEVENLLGRIEYGLY